MDRLAQFEYPLPVIKCGSKSVEIETSGGFEGDIRFFDGGGSTLTGTITSNSGSIIFSPENFSGNDVTVNYSLGLDIYRQGDVLKTSALVVSNGGELVIPITIKIIPPAVRTKEGGFLASLTDYLEYANKNPVAARQMFTQRDFMMWLFSMGYEHMEIYEQFAKDPNKERAVDNFLVFNGQKEKSSVKIEGKSLEFTVLPSDDVLTGGIKCVLSSWGYIDASLFVVEGDEWLKLNKDRFTSADFMDINEIEADYMIFPKKIKGKSAFARVTLMSDGEVTSEVIIHVKVGDLISAKLEKISYDFEDKGFILLTNNTGADLMVEIVPKDNYVRFEGSKYFISKTARIEFIVKFGGLQLAQKKLKREFSFATVIMIKVSTDKLVYRKELKLYLSGLKE